MESKKVENSIPEKIYDAIYDFERATGRRPKAIYLGYEEVHELRKFVAQYYNMNFFPKDEDSEFEGVKVHEVRREHHFELL